MLLYSVAGGQSLGLGKGPQSWSSSRPKTHLSGICLMRTQQNLCPLVDPSVGISYFASFSLSLSLCPSVCLSVPVYQSIFPSLLLSLSPTLSLSDSVCLSHILLSLFLCVSASFSVNLCVCFSPLSPFLFLSLSFPCSPLFCLSVSFSLSLAVKLVSPPKGFRQRLLWGCYVLTLCCPCQFLPPSPHICTVCL